MNLRPRPLREPRNPVDTRPVAERISALMQIQQGSGRVTSWMASVSVRLSDSFTREGTTRLGAAAQTAHRQSWLPLLYGHPASRRLSPVLASRESSAAGIAAGEAARDANILIAAVARQQDRAAFARLFEFYCPRLTSHLLARGAAPATAEEIVQDVMLTVWRKADQFDATRGSAGAWIFTLARNAFIDRVRREHRPAVDPSDPLLCGAGLPDADQSIMDAESQRELAAAVEALPAEQRHVVHCSYFQGQSLAQISAREGLPLGTVKTRARLALERLRAMVTQRRTT